jgi:hypothetical protein
MSVLTLTVPAQRGPTPAVPDLQAPAPVMPAARLTRSGTLVTYVVATPYSRVA